MKRLLKLTIRCVLISLLVIEVAIIGLILMLNSSAGNRWLLQQADKQVDNLYLDYKGGTLVQGLHFNLHLKTEAANVDIQRGYFALSHGCWLKLRVCIRQLSAERLSVDLLDQGPAEEPPIEPPASQGDPVPPLPFPLVLQQLTIETLAISQAGERLTEESQLKLSGRWFGHRVKLDKLSSENPWCHWYADGVVRLKQNFPLNINLGCTAQLPELEQLSAQLNLVGSIEKLDIDGEGQLNHSALPAPLAIRLSASFAQSQLNLTRLDLKHNQDLITTQGQLNLEPEIHWHGATTIHTLNWQQWLAELPGQLQGSITHNVLLTDAGPEARVKLSKFQTTDPDQPLRLAGDLLWQQERLQLNKIKLTSEQNLIQLDGWWQADGSDLALQLDLPKLSALLPDLSGQAKGKARVQGTIQQPSASFSLQTDPIKYQQFSLQQLQAKGRWQGLTADNQLQLSVQQLQPADNLSLNIDVQMNGNLADHQLALSLKESQGNGTQLRCQGAGQLEASTKSNAWQASCDQWQLTLIHPEQEQQWQLQQPLELSSKDFSNLTLSPWCLSWQDASLCNTTAVTLSATDTTPIALRGRQLDLSWSRPWLPENLALSGQLALAADFSGSWQDWQLDTTITSQNISSQVNPGKGDWLTVPFTNTAINAQVTPTQTALDWQLVTQGFGHANGELSLIDNQTINGQVNWQELNLKPLAGAFLTEPGDQVTGVAQGKIQLAGTLAAPQVTGNIQLQQGGLSSNSLPFPLEKIQLQANFNNQTATVNGDFQVLEQTGKVSGQLDWQADQWRSDIKLVTGVIPYQYNDDILVNLKPDLRIQLTPNAVVLAGDLHIPKTRIYLKKLPPQAKTSSADEVVIGEETAEESFAITTDLNVILGNDVYFNGLGLETKLKGKLHLQQQSELGLLSASGIIQLQDGTYQAYGQSLTIVDGDLIFIDDIENPQLRLKAKRDPIVGEVEVGVQVTGRAQAPRVQLYSIPNMSQQEQVHYLITGRAPNTQGKATDNEQLAAETALALALESQSTNTRKVGRKLGIQDLTITADSSDDGSQLALAGYITPDLMIRYGVGMFDTANSITLRYRLHKNLFLEIMSGQSNAFDLLYSFSRGKVKTKSPDDDPRD